MRELLEEYVPCVYRFALRLANDTHEAEDVTQETMLRAWRKRHILREPQVARVWLFRIAVNVWRDRLRRRRSLVSQAGPLATEPFDRRKSPDEQAADEEDARLALEALQKLPEGQRQALYLRACEGLSAEEIAIVLGSNANAVKATLCAARKKIREQLRELFHFGLLIF